MVRNYPSAWPPSHQRDGMGPDLDEEEEDLRLLCGAVSCGLCGQIVVSSVRVTDHLTLLVSSA